MKTIIASAGALCLLAGCASSSINYAPPTASPEVANSAVINEPFDVVWDKLVRQLSSDFFVINNIDKGSHIINISFSTSRPTDLVDCGQTHRTVSTVRGERDFAYATADSAIYSFIAGPYMRYDVRRTTRLDGRANIYVAPADGGTSISVNAKYILEISQVSVRADGIPGPSGRSVVDFSTKNPSAAGSDSAACQTKGVIEGKIIGFATKAS